jgi:hypothetical protein
MTTLIEQLMYVGSNLPGNSRMWGPLNDIGSGRCGHMLASSHPLSHDHHSRLSTHALKNPIK